MTIKARSFSELLTMWIVAPVTGEAVSAQAHECFVQRSMLAFERDYVAGSYQSRLMAVDTLQGPVCLN